MLPAAAYLWGYYAGRASVTPRKPPTETLPIAWRRAEQFKIPRGAEWTGRWHVTENAYGRRWLTRGYKWGPTGDLYSQDVKLGW